MRKVPSYLHATVNSVDRRHRPIPDRRVNLDELIQEEDEMSSISSLSDAHSCSVESVTAEETISVCLRLRPIKKVSIIKPFKIINNTLIAKGAADANSLNKDLSEKHYTFTNIFEDSVSQRELYDVCVQPQMDKFFGVGGATFLTYGTSGSGKTFTLLGSNEQPGIVPRTLLQIFKDYNQEINPTPMVKVENDALIVIDDNTVDEEIAKVLAIKQQMAHSDETFLSMKASIECDTSCSDEKQAKLENMDGKIFIWISFAEIYNENVFDLLADDQNFLKKRSMKVLSNDGNAYIKGLTSLFAKSSEDAYSILQYGMKNATYGSTDVNDKSSRSHCIFFITVISYHIQRDITWVTYKFCDLAGSERLKKTGNIGNRLKEAQRINTSLMVLGRCLDIVHTNQRQKRNPEFVPFRESKLTMLLQSALLGKEKLTMIVNLLPIEEFFEENINVLNFSSIAKQIVVQKHVAAKKNRRSSQFSYFMEQVGSSPSKMRVTHERYETEIKILQDNIFQKDEEMQTMRDEMQMLYDENQQLRKDLFDQERDLRNELVEDFEAMTKKRNEGCERRLQHSKELAIKPYQSKINRLEEKVASLKDELGECDEDISKLQAENAGLKMKINLLEKEKPKRRNSL